MAIRVEHLGKQYRIGGRQERYRTLRSALAESISAPFRRAARLLKGESTGAADLDAMIWALRDVSFEVQRGEVVGIIGRNGAGKSTLLKILSRITEPTEGYAEVYGRVGSLLEVGTGFHPELTGRENVYLNGAILGMTRAEIDRRFDEIVAFAEVERFVDTPVKHYSSGMYLRLAFAVAAHLEPEILLVDEVLAVGDVAFQKKCLGKMSDVAHEGRTVLFVSHNMSAVVQLCERGIMLHEGRTYFCGSSSEAVRTYLAHGVAHNTEQSYPLEPDKPAQITGIRLEGYSDEGLDCSQPFAICLNYVVRQWPSDSYVAVAIKNEHGVRVLWSHDVKDANGLSERRKPGIYTTRVGVPGNVLRPGYYAVSCAIVSLARRQTTDFREDALTFRITDSGSLLGRLGIDHPAVTVIPLEWETWHVGEVSQEA